MYQNKPVFIIDPGVIGIIIHKHHDNSITAVYYLDGISYRVHLLKDEYQLRFGDIVED